jgi:hypothetical protein
METVLRGLKHDASLVYLDDVIIFGSTIQQHLLKLRKVVPRSPPETQPGKVSTFTQRSKVAWAYCLT